MKRPTAFRPGLDGLEARSLLSTIPSVPHPAVHVDALRIKASKHLPPTTTTMTSSAAQSPFAAPVTFTARVVAGKRKAGNPTGTFTFKDGNTVLATVPVSITKRVGTASFRTSVLLPGNHSIVATYSGNKKLATSTSTPVALLVPRVPTTVKVSGPQNVIVGQPTTFTATVVPSGASPGVPPTGTVAFSTDADLTFTMMSLQVVNGISQATFTFTPPPDFLGAGHGVIALYLGDMNYQ